MAEGQAIKRRGILAAAGAMVAGLAAKQAGQRQPVQAADGDALILGHSTNTFNPNVATGATEIRINSGNSDAGQGVVFVAQAYANDVLFPISAAFRAALGGWSTSDFFPNGVYGYSEAARNVGGYGVVGSSLNSNGVLGVTKASGATSAGVAGRGNIYGPAVGVIGQGGGSETGVQGTGGDSNGPGMIGTGGGGSGTGVIGLTSNAANPGAGANNGVYGRANAGSVSGVYGQNDAASGFGVAGRCDASSGVGVLGTSLSHIGVQGMIANGSTAANAVAVSGINQSTGANAIGVYGSSTNGTGVVGVTGTAFNYGVLGQALTANATAIAGACTGNGSSAFSGGTTNPNAYAGVFQGTVVVQGKLVVSDPSYKSGALQHPDGSTRLVYCVESPESWIEDVGTGTLSGGKATVIFDKDFAAVTHTDTYHVFLTPYDGACKGLGVTVRRADGFVVQELNGGTTSGQFSWKVMVRAKGGVKSERLGKFTMPNLPLPDLSKFKAPEMPVAAALPKKS